MITGIVCFIVGIILGALVGMAVGFKYTIRALDEEGWIEADKLEEEYGPNWSRWPKRFRKE